jgi:hypothetical protein
VAIKLTTSKYACSQLQDPADHVTSSVTDNCSRFCTHSVRPVQATSTPVAAVLLITMHTSSGTFADNHASPVSCRPAASVQCAAAARAAARRSARGAMAQVRL